VIQIYSRYTMDLKTFLKNKDAIFYGTLAVVCLIAFAVMKYFHITEGMEDTGMEVGDGDTAQKIKGDPQQVKQFMNKVSDINTSSQSSGNTVAHPY